MTDDYPDQYLEGLHLFNEREFFACHDVLEELWTETVGEERRFLQGLIQAAVGLFHFGNGNLGGARKMYLAAVEKLHPYGDRYWGLHLEEFLTDLQAVFQELLDAKGEYPHAVTLQEDRIPRMVFTP